MLNAIWKTQKIVTRELSTVQTVRNGSKFPVVRGSPKIEKKRAFPKKG
jgi:hypothetical protein